MTAATDRNIAGDMMVHDTMVHHLARACEDSCFLSPNLFVLDRVNCSRR